MYVRLWSFKLIFSIINFLVRDLWYFCTVKPQKLANNDFGSSKQKITLMEIQLLKPSVFPTGIPLQSKKLLTGKVIHYSPCSNLDRHFSICQTTISLHLLNCVRRIRPGLFSVCGIWCTTTTKIKQKKYINNCCSFLLCLF